MKNNHLILLLLLLNPISQLKAQNISGYVKDIYNNPLAFTSILIKENELDDKILLYTKTNKEGKFVFNQTDLTVLNKESFFIETSLNGYNGVIKKISINNNEEHSIINFTLSKIQVEELEEIIIIGKIPKFKVTQDTLAFKVKEYTDGSERKIEDVLKNLPGIKVNSSTGEILYKGKSIETVTLDGDNLFGFNYTLGTRNINVDMVEQIEAIDNYSENPLLKGIEQGGKVSLNLKLKESKTKHSGNLGVGLGMYATNKLATDTKGTLLSTSLKRKSFATLSQNNTGFNHSPFDYVGFNLNTEQKKENNHFANKIIPEAIFTSPIGLSKSNINNQLFGNYNTIFKLNSRLNIKVNLYYLKDKISSIQSAHNNYQINNEIFTTTDNTTTSKKPMQYRGDFEIKYHTSSNSLLEYNLRLRQENIISTTELIQNQIKNFSTSLNTEDFYLSQKVLWTKKLSNKKALQASIIHSFNDLPQIFIITPTLFESEALKDKQESRFKKTFIEGKTTYLGSKEKDKYTFSLGASVNYSPFVSKLFNLEDIISKNDTYYSQKNMFNTGVYNFNYGEWQVSPSYSIKALEQTLNQNIGETKQSKKDLIFEPALNIKYNLNPYSFLTINFGYDKNTNTEQHLFLNQVLISNRTSISNLPELNLQSNQRYNFLYFNNDIYKQIEISTSIAYNKTTGNFFNNQNITENSSQIEYFFLPQAKNNWNIDLQVSKYIPFIESTFKLISFHSISKFKNIVNNSDLRQNKNHFISNSFFWKTAFDMPVNFDNTITYQYSTAKSEQSTAFTNKSWQNTFNLITKFNQKWFFIVSSDYYLPNTKQSKQDFIFLDATLRHSPNSRKWEANLSLRNLTNEKNFEQVQTSDIATSIYRSNLLPRYFLLNFTWNF